MPLTYPIITVPQASQGDVEQMGSKPKFWFRRGDERWLFKEARERTGEDWAEKLASEIAKLLGLTTHHSELAEASGKRGVAVKSFLKPGQALIHGNELLGGLISGYDKHKQRGQSDHTVDNIIHVVERLFPSGRSRNLAATHLIGYFFLDALVGNTDRHHENWGIVLTLRPGPERSVMGVKLAPTFDHASSLGRELTDAARERHLLDHSIERYMMRGRGGIHLNGNSRHGPSPIRLAEHLFSKFATLSIPWRERLHTLTESDLTDLVWRVPDERMSNMAREFTSTFLRISRKRLLSLS